jgi:hypothetical protein
MRILINIYVTVLALHFSFISIINHDCLYCQVVFERKDLYLEKGRFWVVPVYAGA